MDYNGTNAGYGVFFAKNSPFNYSGKTIGGLTIGAAELEAIEWAIKKAPLLDKLILFSDSTYAINAIKDALKSNVVSAKAQNYPVLRRILSAIKERYKLGCSVELLHIYSHVERKIKDWTKNKQHLCLKRLYGELKELAIRFGSYNWIIKGNVMADKLAGYTLVNNTSKTTLTEGLEAYVICHASSFKDSNPVPLIPSFRQHLLKEDKKIHDKNFALDKDAHDWCDLEMATIPLSRTSTKFNENEITSLRKIRNEAVAGRAQTLIHLQS